MQECENMPPASVLKPSFRRIRCMLRYQYFSMSFLIVQLLLFLLLCAFSYFAPSHIDSLQQKQKAGVSANFAANNNNVAKGWSLPAINSPLFFNHHLSIFPTLFEQLKSNVAAQAEVVSVGQKATGESHSDVTIFHAKQVEKASEVHVGGNENEIPPKGKLELGKVAEAARLIDNDGSIFMVENDASLDTIKPDSKQNGEAFGSAEKFRPDVVPLEAPEQVSHYKNVKNDEIITSYLSAEREGSGVSSKITETIEPVASAVHHEQGGEKISTFWNSPKGKNTRESSIDGTAANVASAMPEGFERSEMQYVPNEVKSLGSAMPKAIQQLNQRMASVEAERIDTIAKKPLLSDEDIVAKGLSLLYMNEKIEKFNKSQSAAAVEEKQDSTSTNGIFPVREKDGSMERTESILDASAAAPMQFDVSDAKSTEYKTPETHGEIFSEALRMQNRRRRQQEAQNGQQNTNQSNSPQETHEIYLQSYMQDMSQNDLVKKQEEGILPTTHQNEDFEGTSKQHQQNYQSIEWRTAPDLAEINSSLQELPKTNNQLNNIEENRKQENEQQLYLDCNEEAGRSNSNCQHSSFESSLSFDEQKEKQQEMQNRQESSKEKRVYFIDNIDDDDIYDGQSSIAENAYGGTSPPAAIRSYYGVIDDLGVPANLKAGKVLPRTEIYFAPFVISPTDIFGSLSSLSTGTYKSGSSRTANHNSYSYSANVVPACKSALDGAMQGLTPAWLASLSHFGEVLGSAQNFIFSPFSSNRRLEEEIFNKYDGNDVSVYIHPGNELFNHVINENTSSAKTNIQNVDIYKSNDSYNNGAFSVENKKEKEEEEKEKEKEENEYAFLSSKASEGGNIYNNNTSKDNIYDKNKHTNGASAEGRNLQATAGLISYGVCSVSKVLSDKNSNVIKETCDCINKNNKMTYESKCAVYNSLFAALSCTADPPNCDKVEYKSNEVVIEDMASLDLPLVDLLNGEEGYIPDRIPNEIMNREGYTYYLLWKSANSLYVLHQAYFCARMIDFKKPHVNFILPGWHTEAYVHTAPSRDQNDEHLMSIISRRDDQVYILTRGTKTRFEWKLNFETHQTFRSLVKLPDYTVKVVPWAGKVHYGYALIFESIFPSILVYLQNLLSNNINNNYSIRRIIVSGHSLGSAVSILLAYQLSLIFPGKVDMVGFGSPKVGDRIFQEAFRCRVNARIIQFTLDPVTEMPCDNMLACDEDTAFVPTKLSDDDTTFNYVNDAGLVLITPSMMPTPNWSLLGANLQAYATHTCAYTCFLTSTFVPLDTNTHCKPHNNNSDNHPHTISGDVCPLWLTTHS